MGVAVPELAATVSVRVMSATARFVFIAIPDLASGRLI
jgi:hypothetical protein